MPVAMPEIMPAAIPAEAIFCEDQGILYLVVNWRVRRERRAPAQLLTLSERHATQLREMRTRGRRDLAIHNVLFLPQASCAQILGARPGAPTVAPTAAAAAASAAAAEPLPPTPVPLPQPISPRQRAMRMGWGISACLHLLALCVCCSIAWLIPVPDAPLPTAPQELLLPPAGPPAETAQAQTALAIADPISPDDPAANDPIQPLDVTADATVDDTVDASRPRPDLLGVMSTSATPGREMFIASKSKDADTIGPRGWQRRAAALTSYGGNQASQNAVDAALRWLKRSQRQDGAWDPYGDNTRCPLSEMGREQQVVIGDPSTLNCAMTGMALLCYLGAGYDQDTPSRYRAVVRAGLSWLLAQQGPDGYLGKNNYSNGIATMALCEALSSAADQELRAAAQRAVKAILAHQNRVAGPDGGEVGYGQRSGWDYVGPSSRDDSSVTGWNLMALRSARAVGLDVGNGLEGVRDWLDTTWRATNLAIGVPGTRSGESRFPYIHVLGTEMTVLGPANGTMCDLAGVGAVAAAFMPHDGSERQLKTLANYIERVQTPRRADFNRYYVYYDSLAMFQLGQQWWSRWNRPMRDQLIASQRRDRGCVEGSWDAGNGGFCRTFSTALCCLSLEVYYRYDRVRSAQ